MVFFKREASAKVALQKRSSKERFKDEDEKVGNVGGETQFGDNNKKKVPVNSIKRFAHVKLDPYKSNFTLILPFNIVIDFIGQHNVISNKSDRDKGRLRI
nr:hypothetical protein Iba_chr07cCG5270 [Ipomoea batatas]